MTLCLCSLHAQRSDAVMARHRPLPRPGPIMSSSSSSTTLLDFSLACFSFSPLTAAAAAVITAASHVLTVINLTGENEIYMANSTYWPALCRCNLSKCCTKF